MDEYDRETFIFPSFADLYKLSYRHADHDMDEFTGQELQQYINQHGICKKRHKKMADLWADKSLPSLERIEAMADYFEELYDRLEGAYAESYVHARRLAYGPETFDDVRINYCDIHRGGEFGEAWDLINKATHGAGDTCRMSDWSDKPLMTYPIEPKSPWPQTFRDRDFRIAINIVSENLEHFMDQGAAPAARKARWLAKYGH